MMVLFTCSNSLVGGGWLHRAGRGWGLKARAKGKDMGTARHRAHLTVYPAIPAVQDTDAS